MNYNPGHIDLSGLPRAIDFEAQVARNREIIKDAVTVPAGGPRYRVWHNGQWIVNPDLKA